MFSIVSFPNEECVSILDSTNGKYQIQKLTLPLEIVHKNQTQNSYFSVDEIRDRRDKVDQSVDD